LSYALFIGTMIAAGISDFNVPLSYVLKEQFVYTIILLNQLQ